MIRVIQDASKIPQEWLDKVAALQTQLDQLATPAQRSDFIDQHREVWGEIKNQLLEMSHGKCWYSEAPDAVSDWHVDHFRPKNRALDADRTEHEGYQWLAFNWKNYRIAGSFPNSPHRDGDGATRGKWDYFPLAHDSVRGTWDHRDCSHEICLLLDPVKPNDPKLLTFDEEGIPIPSDAQNPIAVHKVKTTVRFLYLDSPRLIAARKKKWREMMEWIEEYRRCCPEKYADCRPDDFARFERCRDRFRTLTDPASPYAATARACLRANSLAFLIVAPEEAPAA